MVGSLPSSSTTIRDDAWLPGATTGSEKPVPRRSNAASQSVGVVAAPRGETRTVAPVRLKSAPGSGCADTGAGITSAIGTTLGLAGAAEPQAPRQLATPRAAATVAPTVALTRAPTPPHLRPTSAAPGESHRGPRPPRSPPYAAPQGRAGGSGGPGPGWRRPGPSPGGLHGHPPGRPPLPDPLDLLMTAGRRYWARPFFDGAGRRVEVGARR